MTKEEIRAAKERARVAQEITVRIAREINNGIPEESLFVRAGFAFFATPGAEEKVRTLRVEFESQDRMEVERVVAAIRAVMTKRSDL